VIDPPSASVTVIDVPSLVAVPVFSASFDAVGLDAGVVTVPRFSASTVPSGGTTLACAVAARATVASAATSADDKAIRFMTLLSGTCNECFQI
jgi:hypothetical protein